MAEPISGPNYASNSHKSRENKTERPKLEKAISGEAVERKKPLGKRIAETFTGDDIHSVGHYVLFDVVIPAAKDLISDIVDQGTKRLLFGGTIGPRTRRSPSGSTYNYTPYNQTKPRGPLGRAGEADGPGRRDISSSSRRTHDFREIVIPDRGEAELVLDRLVDSIDQYKMATVSDLYDLVGITAAFTDDKWGWTNLSEARAVRTRDGYVLDLPAPEPLN